MRFCAEVAQRSFSYRSLCRTRKDERAGHTWTLLILFFREIPKIGRAIFVLSSTERKTHVFGVQVGAFSVFHSSAKQSWSFQTLPPTRRAKKKEYIPKIGKM
jgi:hypothetical protein